MILNRSNVARSLAALVVLLVSARAMARDLPEGVTDVIEAEPSPFLGAQTDPAATVPPDAAPPAPPAPPIVHSSPDAPGAAPAATRKAAMEAAAAAAASRKKNGATRAPSREQRGADDARKGAPASAQKADAAAAEDRPQVQTIGENDQKIFLVDHKGTWSMHAENVVTHDILRLWHEAGGPTFTLKLPIDRPYTLSVHQLPAEHIIERLLESYGYTLHYDDAGKLVSVRVYSPRESAAFKTPRLTETLAKWKEIESPPK